MATTAFIHTVDGRVLPLPGAYAIDPMHSNVGFQVQYLGISKVRGRFTDFEGVITIGETPGDSSVRVSIQAASIDTAQAQRDAHVRTSDFLDVDSHPTLEFVSTGIEDDGEAWRVHGDLTVRGTTRPVVLNVELGGAGPDLVGDPEQPRVGFTADTAIDRDDFGVTFNQALETGGWLVSKQVRIELDVQAARR